MMRKLRGQILGLIVWLLYRSLYFTWRISFREPKSLRERLESREPVVLAHWHGDELGLLYVVRRYSLATLTSTSKDGEIMNTVLRLLGATTTRGSSTRGAISGFKALVRLCRERQLNCSFAVDGPKGPIYKVKPGVFEMARLLNAPVIPGGIAVDRAWQFPKAWNKTFLPKPFARIFVYWSDPLFLVDGEDTKSAKLSESLESALHQARESAKSFLSRTNSEC